MAALIHPRSDHGRPATPMLWDPWRFERPLHWCRGARIHETADAVSVVVDLPGVDAEDIDIALDRGTLEIVGRRDTRRYAFRATVGDGIDADGIEARLERGVLAIHMPKLASAKPRRIAVRAEHRSGVTRIRRWWRRWFGKQ